MNPARRRGHVKSRRMTFVWRRRLRQKLLLLIVLLMIISLILLISYEPITALFGRFLKRRMVTNGCVICYRVSTSSVVTSSFPNSEIKTDHNHDGVNKLEKVRPERLKLFLQILNRHLNLGQEVRKFGRGVKNDLGSGWLPILDQITTQTGVDLFCEDCSSVVDSYCQLFHQMKTIELLLNWKLAKLKNIMAEAPQMEHQFGEWVKQFALVKVEGADVTPSTGVNGDHQEKLVKDMSNLKNDIMEKIGRKEQKTCPRVPLDKWHSSQKKLTDHCPSPKLSDEVEGAIIDPPSDLNLDPALSIQTQTKTEDAHLPPPPPPGVKMEMEPSLTLLPQHVKLEPCDDNVDVDEPPMCVLVATTTATENSIDIDMSTTVPIPVKLEPQELIVPEDDPLADPLADEDPSPASKLSHILVFGEEMGTEMDSGNLEDGLISESCPTVSGVSYVDYHHHQNRSPVTIYSPAVANNDDPGSSKGPPRKLRSVFRCSKCMRSFSTPDKLKEHQLSHEKDEDWDKLSSASSTSSKGAGSNKDKDDLEEESDVEVPNSDSGSGSEYNSDEEVEEQWSDEDDNIMKSFHRRGTRRTYAAAFWPTPSKLGYSQSERCPQSEVLSGINGASAHAQFTDMQTSSDVPPTPSYNLSGGSSHFQTESIPVNRKIRRQPLFGPNQTSPRRLRGAIRGRVLGPEINSAKGASAQPQPQMPMSRLSTTKPPSTNFLRTLIAPASPSPQSSTKQYNLSSLANPTRVTTTCKICKAKFFAHDQASLVRKLRVHKETQHQKKKKTGGDASVPIPPAPPSSALHKCDRKECTASFKNAFQLQAHIFTAHGIVQKQGQRPLLNIPKVKNHKKGKELPKM